MGFNLEFKWVKRIVKMKGLFDIGKTVIFTLKFTSRVMMLQLVKV
jgi:hypothetical protein